MSFVVLGSRGASVNLRAAGDLVCDMLENIVFVGVEREQVRIRERSPKVLDSWVLTLNLEGRE